MAEVKDRREEEDSRQLNQLQREEMQRHKWIESEKAGRDLGEQACIDWVEKHAARFRQQWEQTLPEGDRHPRSNPGKANDRETR